MSSAICFDLDQSKILSSGNWLTSTRPVILVFFFDPTLLFLSLSLSLSSPVSLSLAPLCLCLSLLLCLISLFCFTIFFLSPACFHFHFLTLYILSPTSLSHSFSLFVSHELFYLINAIYFQKLTSLKVPKQD